MRGWLRFLIGVEKVAPNPKTGDKTATPRRIPVAGDLDRLSLRQNRKEGRLFGLTRRKCPHCACHNEVEFGRANGTPERYEVDPRYSCTRSLAELCG
jgi:hypothetical protein